MAPSLAQIRTALRGLTKCPVSNAKCPYMGGSPAEAEAALNVATSRCPFLSRALAQDTPVPSAATSKCPFHSMFRKAAEPDDLQYGPFEAHEYNGPSFQAHEYGPSLDMQVGPPAMELSGCCNQHATCPAFEAIASPTGAAVHVDTDVQLPEEIAPGSTASETAKTTDYDAFFGDVISGLKAEGRYRQFRRIDRKRGELPMATADGTPGVTNWCSNDYLAMGQTDEVVGAAEAASLGQRTGMGHVPSVSQVALEQELASLHGKDAAKVFNSCYTANEAAISGIVRSHPGCTIITDKSNHASMIQGIRQSGAPKLLWEHNDLEHLEALLSTLPSDTPKLVVFESVYSMDGSVAPIEAVVDLCERYNAMTFLDEVHAVGLYGDEGAGVAQRDGVMHRVDAISGTLGKAYGVIGGYVALKQELADAMSHELASRVPYQEDNFLPPPVADAARSSVQALRGPLGQQMRAAHQAHSTGLMQLLEQNSIPVQASASHIVPVMVGDAVKVKQAADMLLDEHNIYVQPINYPTVARGTERLRFTPGPLHTEDMQIGLVDALKDVWEKVGISPHVSTTPITVDA